MEQKKHEKAVRMLLAAALICMISAAVYSGWGLYCYSADYFEDRQRYQDLREEVLSDGPEAETVSGADGQEERETAEQAPFSVDWERLSQINGDIIGWIYFTGLPQISYPILQAQDNTYYVNRTYDLSSDDSKAGSIFMDCRMNGDFSSPYSVIYGHNVRDGSMFSDLARLKEQSLYDAEPYFWILTQEGDYRYRIFSVFQCSRSADVFQKYFNLWGKDFSEWEQELKERSVMNGDEELGEDDHVVVLATCVPNSYDRTIVCGRCVSKVQPPFLSMSDLG